MNHIKPEIILNIVAISMPYVTTSKRHTKHYKRCLGSLIDVAMESQRLYRDILKMKVIRLLKQDIFTKIWLYY